MFRKYNINATVKRATYETDGGYKKSTYEETGNVYAWHLSALSIKDMIDKSAFGKEYLFTTHRNADIKESDKLIIGTTEYDVKWVSDYQGQTFQTKKVLLNKL